jgi:hypothetical protein
MHSDFTYYIMVLVAIVIGIIVVKKITSCLIKSIIFLALLGALAALYFVYFR